MATAFSARATALPAGPLTGTTLILAAIAIGLGNFLVVLDTTIANVSIPTIAGALGVSSSQGTWVIPSYAVAEAINVPLTGWLAKDRKDVVSGKRGAVRVDTGGRRHIK